MLPPHGFIKYICKSVPGKWVLLKTFLSSVGIMQVLLKRVPCNYYNMWMCFYGFQRIALCRCYNGCLNHSILYPNANHSLYLFHPRAQSQATGILNEYRQEAASYRSLMDSNGLTVEGLLAYMSVRAIAASANPVNVNLGSPAKTSYLQDKNNWADCMDH